MYATITTNNILNNIPDAVDARYRPIDAIINNVLNIIKFIKSSNIYNFVLFISQLYVLYLYLLYKYIFMINSLL